MNEQRSSDATLPAMPEAVYFQRQANQWLRDVRAEGIAEPSLQTAIPSLEVDFFDIFRGHLNITNGAILADLYRAAITPPHDKHSRSTAGAASFTTANVKETPNSNGEWKTSSQPSLARRAWFRCKAQAYTWRRAYERRFLGVETISRRPSGRVVLLFPRHIGHLTDILPVATKIRELDGASVVCAALDRRLAKYAYSGGLPVIGVFSSLTSQLRRWRVEATQLLPSIERVIQRTICSTEFDPDQANALADNTVQTMRNSFHDLYITARAVKHLLDVFDPELVLVGNPYTYEGRLAAVAARARSIPAAVIEHGSIFPNDPIWEECPIDLVCAWGNPSRDALLSCGIANEQIVVTGAPRYDSIFARAQESGLRKDPAQAYLLVATSGPGDQVTLDQHLDFIRALYRAAATHPEIRWLIKLHKKDRPEYYATPAGSDVKNVTVVRNQTAQEGLYIFEYLRAARGLVTISSTAALDAMAVDVPVITYDVWPEGRGLTGVRFLVNDSTYRTRDPSGLAKVAHDLWHGQMNMQITQAAQAYAADHFANRGNAAEVAGRKLIQLLNLSQSNKPSARV